MKVSSVKTVAAAATANEQQQQQQQQNGNKKKVNHRSSICFRTRHYPSKNASSVDHCFFRITEKSNSLIFSRKETYHS